MTDQTLEFQAALVKLDRAVAALIDRDVEDQNLLDDRRRAGLTDLVEVHRTQRSPAVDVATGQTLLFNRQSQFRI